MQHLNIEIKARCTRQDEVRTFLHEHSAHFAGEDHQTDTYFCIPEGRLKLREGVLENALIFYQRANEAEPGKSEVLLYPSQAEHSLKPLLTAALGIRAEVKKKREIYYIDNVKFHIDEVDGLGAFVEIEAQDQQGTLGEQELYEQCRLYMDMLGIRSEDLVAVSYSDMILEQKGV